MENHNHHAYSWYEDDSSYCPSSSRQTPSTTGLPESWRHYGWWLAACALSALWLAQGWTSGSPLVGMTFVNHMSQSLWSLLLTLGLCWGIVKFCERRSLPKLGQALCVLAATGALLGYST